VGKTRRLNNLGVKTAMCSLCGLFHRELLGKPTANLGNLDRVLLTSMEDVSFARADDLRDPRKAAKGGRVEEAVAVTLKL